MKKIISLLLITLCLCSCSNSNEQENNVKQKPFDNGHMHVYVDNDTGVNYLVYREYFNGVCATITPRLNTDGSIYVSEVGNE